MRVLDGGRLRECGTSWRTAGGQKVRLQEHGQFARDGRRLTTSLKPSYSWHCDGCGRVSPATTDQKHVCDQARNHAERCAATG